MKKQEAKELSLEVWRYLVEHPEIKCKETLPHKLYLKINDMVSSCPLCELYKSDFTANHPKCPLKTCGMGSPYNNWLRADDSITRQAFAQKIVAAIEAWEPEEEG